MLTLISNTSTPTPAPGAPVVLIRLADGWHIAGAPEAPAVHTFRQLRAACPGARQVRLIRHA